MKFDDCLTFVFSQPVVTRDPAIVLIHFAVTIFPCEEFAGLNADPAKNVLA